MGCITLRPGACGCQQMPGINCNLLRRSRREKAPANTHEDFQGQKGVLAPSVFRGDTTAGQRHRWCNSMSTWCAEQGGFDRQPLLYLLTRRCLGGILHLQCAWSRSSLPSIYPPANSLHLLVLLPAMPTAISLTAPLSGLSTAPALLPDGSSSRAGLCWSLTPHACSTRSCVCPRRRRSPTPHRHLAVSAHQGSPSYPAQLPGTCTLPWSCPVQRS